GRLKYYVGDPAPVYDFIGDANGGRGNLVLTFTLREDGGIDIAPPDGPSYAIAAGRGGDLLDDHRPCSRRRADRAHPRSSPRIREPDVGAALRPAHRSADLGEAGHDAAGHLPCRRPARQDPGRPHHVGHPPGFGATRTPRRGGRPGSVRWAMGSRARWSSWSRAPRFPPAPANPRTANRARSEDRLWKAAEVQGDQVSSAYSALSSLLRAVTTRRPRRYAGLVA